MFIFDLYLFHYFFILFQKYLFITFIHSIYSRWEIMGQGIWHVRFTRVLNMGLEGINMTYIIIHIISPIMLYLSDFLVIPFFISKLISYFISSYTIQTLLVRYSFLFYLVFRLLFKLTIVAYGYLIVLYNEIRDTRYLLGTELTNR